MMLCSQLADSNTEQHWFMLIYLLTITSLLESEIGFSFTKRLHLSKKSLKI